MIHELLKIQLLKESPLLGECLLPDGRWDELSQLIGPQLDNMETTADLLRHINTLDLSANDLFAVAFTLGIMHEKGRLT